MRVRGIIDTQLQEGLKQEGRKASLGGFLRSGVLADAIADKNLEAGIQKSHCLAWQSWYRFLFTEIIIIGC